MALLPLRAASLLNHPRYTTGLCVAGSIGSEDVLLRPSAVEAYHRLKFRFGRHVTLMALYAMEAALRGCEWRSLEPVVRDDLRKAARRP
ncbi:TfoX/Sxy family DNA transformation protein [Methylocystis sp. FS]|uniref:TfoX/Sxy family DNA transformation protein n=1 Tax=Methylocystis TaxID=133 RepID=UPI0015819D70|nr:MULTISPECIES: TfoX/Sxy family DNA transformation protein [Methylocystis]MBG0799933.1 TfoX/Sxy family DNA transformation protein [Methylocystis sp. H4A]NUJ81892.1 TfoX/Sxy family DNA transformation protein [Methylocystis silviterrae]